MSEFTEAMSRTADAATARFERSQQSPPRDFHRELGRRRRARFAVAGVASIVGVVLATTAVAFGLRWFSDEVQPAVPGELRWSLDVGSELWSTPLVVGDRAYLGAADGSLYAVDLEDGSIAWSFATSDAVRSTPVDVDGMIVFSSDDNVVYAVRDDGDDAALEWSTEISAVREIRGRYDTTSSSPVVVDGLIVVGSTRGVVALDVVTGEIAWSLESRSPVRSTPACTQTTCVVGGNDGYLRAIDVATGVVAWEVPFGGAIVSSPAIVDGLVLSGSRNTQIRALDLDSGEEVWAIDIAPSWAESSVVIDGDTAYFGSSNAGTVFAVDAASGEVRWEALVRGMPWPRPTVDHGTVYVNTAIVDGDPSWPHTVYALRASDGVPLWRAGVGAALTWNPGEGARGALTSPVVFDTGVLVAGLDGILYAFAR